MGGDPKQSGVTFLKKAKEIADLCQNTGGQKLFTGFMASIPIGDDAVENSQKTTWSCVKCKKTFKTPTGHKKHQDACKKDNKTHKGYSVTTDDTDDKSKKDHSAPSKKKPMETKHHAKNDSPSQLKQCMFCSKKRVRINDHYLIQHKLDYDKYTKYLLEEGSQRNDTTCPQCNEDFSNKPALVKHLFEYHNIKLKAKNTRPLLKNKNAQDHAVNEVAASQRETGAIQSDIHVEEERGHIESSPDAQEEMEIGPSSEERETGNSQTQNHAASEVAASQRETGAISRDLLVQNKRGNIESGPDAQEEMEIGSSAGERETGNPNRQDHIERVVAPCVNRNCFQCPEYVYNSSLGSSLCKQCVTVILDCFKKG